VPIAKRSEVLLDKCKENVCVPRAGLVDLMKPVGGSSFKVYCSNCGSGGLPPEGRGRGGGGGD
jgi:hypothetical protein